MSYLLDTNIVSFAVKGNFNILHKIKGIREQNNKIFIRCITYFEIRRGFLAIDAPKQRKNFEEFCLDYQIILLDDLAILEKAA